MSQCEERKKGAVYQTLNEWTAEKKNCVESQKNSLTHKQIYYTKLNSCTMYDVRVLLPLCDGMCLNRFTLTDVK